MPTETAHTESEHKLVAVVRDPVRFARAFLLHDVWSIQADILRAVAKHRRVAVKACHSSGKTFVAAAAVLWFVSRYSDGIVVTTAPTWTQVERLLWGEIHKAVKRSRIVFPTVNKTELHVGPGNYAIGLSTNEGVRFQGFHGRVLIVIDEAPGVKAEIWEAIEGIRAGGDVRVLALGNPTIASGPFHDAFTTNRDGWETFTISAFDSPNLAGLSLGELLALPDEELDRAPRPYLVTRRWVKEKFHEWGIGHPLWEARVLGQFPTQAEDALISLAWIEAAATRPAIDGGGPIVAGLDVAGPGEDETVLAIREGPSILALHVWAQSDPRGEVAAALAPYKHRIETVAVDSVGLGYYFAKHLEDLGYPVRSVNVGEASSDPERYRNLKAEFYWGLRMRFQNGEVAGLDNERVIGQLAGIRYRHNARGQIEIEQKEEARKRGVRSPDRAEAIMLAFARPRLNQMLSLTQLGSTRERRLAPDDEQLRSVFPFLEQVERSTCGECAYIESRPGRQMWCSFRYFIVQKNDVCCSYFAG